MFQFHTADMDAMRVWMSWGQVGALSAIVQRFPSCDNLSTVLAYERAKQGKFSNSSRISAFLMSINKMYETET